MRVTHVITRLIVGGAQENTVSSVLGLQQKPGLKVDLISGPSLGREGSLEKWLSHSPGVLNEIPELVRPIHPWKDWLALRRLIKLFGEFQPDIVHTHSGKAGVLGRLAAARASVPVIVHTIHGPSFGAFQGFLPNLLFRSAEQYAGSVTSHFVVVADAMRELYLSAGIGKPDQYTRIFSGFQMEPFLLAQNDLKLRTSLGIAPEDFVVGKIARLFKLKGHADLLAIAPPLVQHHPRTKFLIVGDGPYRQRFEHQAAACGLRGNFIFTGLVPPENVACLIGIMNVVVHLSLREGLARALPQALAAGRPVLAYDCDGAREVCIEGKTGYLIAPGDLKSLVERLSALASDSELCTGLGQSGREFVQGRFSVEHMVNALHELYLRLTARN
jgi:glycosyltransferase involved in cell wall biosynthesis